jgi:hypothetical protein
MKEDSEHYIKMNPSNKWGNYKGALKVLEDLYNACVENTHATIIIS